MLGLAAQRACLGADIIKRIIILILKILNRIKNMVDFEASSCARVPASIEKVGAGSCARVPALPVSRPSAYTRKTPDHLSSAPLSCARS